MRLERERSFPPQEVSSHRYLAKSFIEFSSNCVSLSNDFSLPPETQYPGQFDKLFAYV